MATTKGGTPPVKPPVGTPVKTGGSGDDGDGEPQVSVIVAPVSEDGEAPPILKRRIDLLRGELADSRLPEEYEFSFDPHTLVGSWFHRLENDVIVWQGAVVAEPRSGVYLVQIDKLDTGAENVQRLIPLERMVADEDGYDWRFYDSEDAAKAAYVAWTTTEKARR